MQDTPGALRGTLCAIAAAHVVSERRRNLESICTLLLKMPGLVHVFLIMQRKACFLK